MELWWFYVCAVLVTLFTDESYAECKFGEIVFKKENDKEEILNDYTSHKLSWINYWNNMTSGRLLDPVCNLLTSKKQTLCECVYEKLYDENLAENHALDADHDRITYCTLRTIVKAKEAKRVSSALMTTCKVKNKIFFLAQGYQWYEKKTDHDVYVFAAKEKTDLLQIKGLVKKLDFSTIEGDISHFTKLRLHLVNANSPHKHE